jgi:DNA mismatch endonuclease (patch repair protein)
MPDHMTPQQRSDAMKRVKLKNGSLEKLVQSELRSAGLRFQRHNRSLPGCPDIVFSKERVAIFVDGDFWHGWRLPKWEYKLSVFWREKLRSNRVRDQRNFRRLRARGWQVVRIWQHELKVPNDGGIVQRILKALRYSQKAKRGQKRQHNERSV